MCGMTSTNSPKNSMRDLSEKYLAIREDFPNKAGKLRQVLETQKRLLSPIMKAKPSEDTKALLVSVAEGYEVTIDLLDYMHKLVQGVANDATALQEGSEIRNVNKMQSQDIQLLWHQRDLDEKTIAELKKKIIEHESARIG